MAATSGAASAATLALTSVAQTLRATGSTHDGLSHEDAAARLHREGPNVLPRLGRRSLAAELGAQFVHFFALLLWAAAGLAWVAGTPDLALAIAVVVVVNGLFSFLQEFRAERLTHALARMLPSTATVLRAGVRERVPHEEVVRGDVLMLYEGDRVPADARVIGAEGLTVDLSMLTGESEPLPRSAEAAGRPPATLADAPNLVLAGSFVVVGSARAVVFATGPRTALAAISRSAGAVRRRPTPLRLELAQAVRTIAAAALFVGLAFFVVAGVLGLPARLGLVFAVGVIVALVPEGLLPTLTLSLAMSAARMAKRRALVKRLDAVETLGAVTTICSDKTGTLTAHQLTARRLVVGGRSYDVTGLGYAPDGTILCDGRPLAPAELDAIRPALRIGALCGNARIVARNGIFRARGDPSDAAFLVLAGKAGLDPVEAARAAHRVREFPFDARRRRMSTLHRLPDGRLELACKGSPEAILAVCDRSGAAPLDAAARAGIAAEVDRLAGDGLRVLAVAHRFLDAEPPDVEEAERGLALLGLIGVSDPVRADVPEAIAACRRAGIRVIMVTGDHPGTAQAVARAVGLAEGPVLTGAELPDDDAALASLLAGVSVLARIEPEQKLRIARALQSRGEVVAMTGDGVNDAPALRQADVGIAMGLSGTDVAREAADLVLLDDHFAHIVAAVEEGRAAFDNIRRFLTYHLTDNVSELLPFAVWALTLGSFPLVLSVLQLLALDIGTDVLPALALGAEPPAPGTMDRPPTSRRASLLDRAVLARAFGFLGPVQATLALSLAPIGAALFFGWRPGQPFPHAPLQVAQLSGAVFTAIVLAQMVNAFECRDPIRGLRELGVSGNRLLVFAVIAELGVLLAFLYVPALARALGVVPPGRLSWVMALVVAALFLVAEELRKARRRRPA